MDENQNSKKTEIISVRLDPETRDCLAYISNLEYRPMALQIRKIIEDYIKDYEQNKLNSMTHQDYPRFLG